MKLLRSIGMKIPALRRIVEQRESLALLNQQLQNEIAGLKQELGYLGSSPPTEHTGLLRLPYNLLHVGDGDPTAIGLEFLRYFRDIGKLKENHSVLDVGCGIGRMAIPLLFYLNEKGSYDGFDIVPEAIEWCQSQITRLNPRFQFHYAPIANSSYKPNGSANASNWRFPYENHSFDFALLTSVFTHMWQADIENYLSEIHRVLKTGGTAFITFFLLNSESDRLIVQGKSIFDFRHGDDVCKFNSERDPLGCVAYAESLVRQLLAMYGLSVMEPIRYGTWSGRGDGLSFQDIIVVEKSSR
jgi:SAM-dependent methyltransferase